MCQEQLAFTKSIANLINTSLKRGGSNLPIMSLSRFNGLWETVETVIHFSLGLQFTLMKQGVNENIKH